MHWRKKKHLDQLKFKTEMGNNKKSRTFIGKLKFTAKALCRVLPCPSIVQVIRLIHSGLSEERYHRPNKKVKNSLLCHKIKYRDNNQ